MAILIFLIAKNGAYPGLGRASKIQVKISYCKMMDYRPSPQPSEVAWLELLAYSGKGASLAVREFLLKKQASPKR
jgi:hypothetical protein